MADYHSVIDKAVSALDLNTEKARRRLYERARAALRSEMHSAYPPFHRSDIAAAEMSLEMAIEAVEAEAVRRKKSQFGNGGHFFQLFSHARPAGERKWQSPSFSHGALGWLPPSS